MTLTPQDAAEALALIDTAQRKSSEMRGYQSFAPHIMLWGAIWAVGYTVTYFAAAAGWVWLALVVIGIAGDIVIARQDHQHESGGATFFWLLGVFYAFIIATLVVMAPHSPNQTAAFIPLVVAAGYVVTGVLGAPRLILTGIAVFVLTLFGFFVLPGVFLLWMAVVGGGGLFLGGLWLRSA